MEVEKIKELDIVEVIGETVDLKREGLFYTGRCPFCHETGFSVNRELHIYKCFSCGAGGPLLKFIQDVYLITFPEAVEWLEKRYAVDQVEEEGHEEGPGHNGRV
jgi:DNA primase